MKLQHIEAFIAVAEEGSVSKAALRLRIVQSALSRQIGNLETELGLRLFERVRQRMVMTGEGERLLADCRSIVASVDALGDRARWLSRTDAGILRVAYTMLDEVLAEFLHRYAESFPNVQVKLSDINGPADLFARLESGELNLGIASQQSLQAQEHKFESQPLPPVEFVAAGHASLSVGSAGLIEVADLDQFPLLLLSPTFQVRKTFDKACRLAGVRQRIFMESRLPHTLLGLAEAGHGVAIGPSSLPTHRYRLRVARVVHEGKPLLEPLSILWSGKRALPRYGRRFGELLETYMRETFMAVQLPLKAQRRNAKRVIAQRK